MGFLIRMAFWFSLVLLALPLGNSENGARQVGALEALVAAGEAVSDIAGMCERKPDVCETGKAAISTVGERAREVSRIASDTLETKSGDPDATVTGSVALPEQVVLPEQSVPPQPAPVN